MAKKKQEKQKIKAAVVAIGRKENQYAREFVEHHLKVGFEHFYIADNNREGEEHFDEVLQDYIDKGVVTIIDYRDKCNCHFRAYNEIYAEIGCKYDWVAFFDFDEQLVIPVGKATGTLANLLTGRECNCVVVNWKCYGDNGLVKNDRRPMAERFTKPLPDDLHVQYDDKTENQHVKSIVRGGLEGITFTTDPHCPEGAGTYETASGEPCEHNFWTPTYDPSRAFIKHYITKTAEEWADKMRRGMAERPMKAFWEAYHNRFFQYNEWTAEKEKAVTPEKVVAIVHYNTPELTEATILSLRKHGGEDYKVVIFDNSDEQPWTKKMKGVEVIDNTKGQIIDFDKELEKYPNKCPGIGIWGSCVYGSAKHMMSIQKLFDLLPDGFLLMDSDILLTADVDFMFRYDQCTVGHIQPAVKAGNPKGIDRLVPMLCWINVPMCKHCGVRYFDPKRAWGLQPGGRNNRGNYYDTGASFLEDIRSHRNGACGKRIDIRPLMVHLASGSWRNKDKAKAWLEQHKDLWFTEQSKPKTRKATIRKGK